MDDGVIEDSPNEGRDGEHGVIDRTGGNDASEMGWKTTTCPVQKNKNKPPPSASCQVKKGVLRTHAFERIPTRGGQ
jgi:hypothetical protein